MATSNFTGTPGSGPRGTVIVSGQINCPPNLTVRRLLLVVGFGGRSHKTIGRGEVVEVMVEQGRRRPPRRDKKQAAELAELVARRDALDADQVQRVSPSDQ